MEISDSSKQAGIDYKSCDNESFSIQIWSVRISSKLCVQVESTTLFMFMLNNVHLRSP